VGHLVTYALDNGIATITMDDGKANALSRALLADLNGALDQAAADQAVTILTGRGTVFCAGFDLKTMNEEGAQHAMVNEGFEVALRLIEHPTPLVIACNGHAIAMGAILLLCGDYRIGVDGMFRVMTNEVAINLDMPWAGIEICRQRLATTHFYRAVSLAEPFTPAEGVTAGFLDEVVTGDELGASAMKKALEYAQFKNKSYNNVKVRTREDSVAAIRAGHARDLAEQH
jgi:enoyl-CoA hydratase